MKVGITGHQQREGIDWTWVRSRIDRFLAGKSIVFGYSSLAAGTDQVFADAILGSGGKLIAVIPMEGYEACFDSESRRQFDRLLSRSKVIDLRSHKREEGAFLDAGKWISKEVDQMVAVWDGESAAGRGGTADIVEYALSIGKRVHHIDPIKQLTLDL